MDPQAGIGGLTSRAELEQFLDDRLDTMRQKIAQLQGNGPGDLPQTGDLKFSVGPQDEDLWLPYAGGTFDTADYPDLATLLGVGGATFTLADSSGWAIVPGPALGSGLTLLWIHT